MTSKWSFFLLLVSIFVLYEAQSYPSTTARNFYGFSTITTRRPHPDDDFTVIRNPKTDLVLDATADVVKARRSTNSRAQLWNVQRTRSGTFRFYNVKTNKVLSIKKGGIFTSHKAVMANPILGDIYQQWYVNSDGSIVNAGDPDLALTINSSDKLVLKSHRTISGRQVFRLQSFEKH